MIKSGVVVKIYLKPRIVDGWFGKFAEVKNRWCANSFDHDCKSAARVRCQTVFSTSLRLALDIFPGLALTPRISGFVLESRNFL